MSHPDNNLIRLIEDDLYNELRWLLNAATQWYGHKLLPKEEQDTFPPNFLVHVMNSAFVHSRSLYEFFTLLERDAKSATAIRYNKATWYTFDVAEPLHSNIYD